MAETVASGWRRGVEAILSELRPPDLWDEDEVKCRLIRPLLKALGWDVRKENAKVPIPLTTDAANRWSYRRPMERDYVLRREMGQALHIEGKHGWGTTTWEIKALLEQFNRDDWYGTEGGGWKKDLALLLWGARSQGARRAALMDENRLLVFDWDEGWRLVAEEKIFQDPPDRLLEALRLLEPSAFVTE
jgi:hypothetical protein